MKSSGMMIVVARSMVSMCLALGIAATSLGAEKMDTSQRVANAGADVTINSDRYHLNASQSNGLPNCEVLWTQVSGPTEATISHATAAITPVIDLNMGVYTFRVTLTSRDGATSSDDVVLTVPAPQVKDKIDEYIISEMEKAGVKGLSLAIIDGGKIVKVKGYGFTDADRKTPVTPLTLFQAASTSKVVTAMGALRLVDSHRLSLDEDVNAKLTSWKVPENEFTKDQKVTLERLIAHMGGINISGFYGYPRGEPVPSLLSILEGKPPANSAPIRVVYVPGSKMAYSGGGYTIIQQLVTDVAGQPFEQYMRDSVFSRLGMASSTFEQPLPPDKWDWAAHGHGYNMPDGASYKAFPHAAMPWKWNNFPEMAAAGLWTTAEDLSLLVMDIQDTYAGRSEKVITKDAVDKMLTPVPGNPNPRMGLGLVLDRPGTPSAVFRFSGASNGFQTSSAGTVRTGQGCVIMYNERGFSADIQTLVAEEYAWPE